MNDMSEVSFEQSGGGETEADYRRFFGSYFAVINKPSEKAKDPEKEVQERKAGIKRLAAIALGLSKSASWADLTKAGGYDAYLKKVEVFCRYGERLIEDETSVMEWAEENGITLTNVSGLTIFKRKNLRSIKQQSVVDKVLLSVTNEKEWTHQPFGGKREAGEGAVAAILGEFGEETDWDSAVQLLRDFQDRKAFYLGCYVQLLADNKARFIQSFSMEGRNFNPGKLGSGSDSLGFVWAGRAQLEGDEGEKMVLTQQAEGDIGRSFGFLGRRPSKFSHPDPEYTGRPDLEWRRERAIR